MSKSLQVINVLSPEYYADAHIKGSINIPLEKLKDFASLTSKDSYIVVYCASYMCTASATAWHVLHELGFEHIYAYEGGMNEWYHAKLPMLGQGAMEYLKEVMQYTQLHQDTAIQKIDMHQLKKMMERERLL